ncbi:Rnf-Nqr domain containing protein, partial [Solemya velum gill symbiont]
FASKNNVGKATVDALAIGIGFSLVLFALGALRELIGQGTLFAEADLMFGPMAADWALRIDDYKGVLLAILPPGAFLGLGFLIAIKNIIDGQLEKRRLASKERAEIPSAEAAANS